MVLGSKESVTLACHCAFSYSFVDEVCCIDCVLCVNVCLYCVIISPPFVIELIELGRRNKIDRENRWYTCCRLNKLYCIESDDEFHFLYISYAQNITSKHLPNLLPKNSKY